MKIVYTLLLAVILSGCSVLQFAAENADVISTAVKAGTLRYIEADGNDQNQRAQRVVEVVEDTIRYVDSDADTTIKELEERVREEIDWSELDASEGVIVDAVIDSVVDRIKDRVGEGLLEEEDRVQVIKILNWVVEAAVMYRE